MITPYIIYAELINFNYRYCSNYIESSKVIEICDWCRSEQKSSPRSSTSSKASTARNVGNIIITSKPSEYSGDSTSPTKGHSASNQTRKNLIINGVPSPRTAARRYKLLKDVKC